MSSHTTQVTTVTTYDTEIRDEWKTAEILAENQMMGEGVIRATVIIGSAIVMKHAE